MCRYVDVVIIGVYIILPETKILNLSLPQFVLWREI